MEIIVTLLFLCAGLIITFIPTNTAYKRNHRNRKAIMMLNIFGGWTLVGWVAALVWSNTRDVEAETPKEEIRQKNTAISIACVFYVLMFMYVRHNLTAHIIY